MKIHRNIEQNSLEWLKLRAGVVTASEMDALVTPLGKVKEGEARKTYLLKKLAETWLGAPIEDVGAGWAAEQGHMLEAEARDYFALATGNEVEQVAFISTDDGRCGCSPDGIIGDEGVEIKCPQVINHVRYLLDGVLPAQYVVQVQFSLWVTGFRRWHFLSYRRGFSALRMTIEPDPKIQAGITEAITQFAELFDSGLKELCRLNGGEPKQRNQMLKPFPKLKDDGRFDILC